MNQAFFFAAFVPAAFLAAGFFAVVFVVFVVFAAGFFAALRLQRRKNTVFSGSVSEMLCSKPCIASSTVRMLLPFVKPVPPNSAASEVNTSS